MSSLSRRRNLLTNASSCTFNNNVQGLLCIAVVTAASFCELRLVVCISICAAGAEGQMYIHDSHMSYTGPSLTCDFLQGDKQGVATKNDCLKAIGQLQDRDNSSCVVTNDASAQGRGQNSTVLAHAGTCQVTLSVVYGKEASLPCSQVLTYATNVATACQNVEGSTGGSLTPTGYASNAAAGGNTILVGVTRLQA